MYIGSQHLLQAYDQALLKKGYTILELVDKASDCLMKHMFHHNYVIFCGPGNNGADGLSLACKLHQKNKNVTICTFPYAKVSRAHDYYYQCALQQDINILEVTDEDFDLIVDALQKSDVVIDAMFGFGLNSSPRGLYQKVIRYLNQYYHHDVIAIDIPTGLKCNEGKPYETCLCATQTITLTAYKNGFLHPESTFYTGEIFLEELDVCDISDVVKLYEWADESVVSPIIKRRQYDGYKGTYGFAGLIVGSSHYKGAAMMATKSSIYAGTGITHVITSTDAIRAINQFSPEAVTSQRPDAFDLQLVDNCHALLIGCGLGLNESALCWVEKVFTQTQQPLVVDADALTLLSRHMDLLENQERDIILTPHLGEFQRLCPFDQEDDVLELAHDFAKKYHVTLVLKGPHTIVCDQDNAYRVSTGNPAMAIGGMGDVLAGMCVSFLAQGYTALEAALLAVYLHGYCGDLLAKDQYTVIPTQLIEKIPYAMDQLIKKK